jgi:(2Fe-2S) ferredoxin
MDSESRPKTVIICVNHRSDHDKPSCSGRGSVAIAQALDAALSGSGVSVTRIKCFGRCLEGPNLRIAPGGRFFRGVSLDDVPMVVAALED